MFFVALSIVLMVGDHRSEYFTQIRSVLSVIVAPVQYVVDWPLQIFSWIESGVSSHKALLNENANLRADIFLLTAKMQRTIALEQENSQLRALLKSSAYLDGNVLVAQLLAVDPDPFVHQVVLDKGTKDQVYVGQPVFDATGVMGQVIQVGPLASRVLLLTDTRSALPIQNNRNGIRAIAEGQGAIATLSLRDIPETTDFKVGDVIVTSGLGQRFPMGYPVGQVISVDRIPGEHFLKVNISPSAHINRSRQVLLVWPANQLAHGVVERHSQIKKLTTTLQQNKRLRTGLSEFDVLFFEAAPGTYTPFVNHRYGKQSYHD